MSSRLYWTLGIAAAVLAFTVSAGAAVLPARVVDRRRAIEFFRGRVVNPLDYPETVRGLAQYLSDSGVGGAAALAPLIVQPRHPEIAAEYGYSSFLPPREWWPKLAALSLCKQYLDGIAGRSSRLYNAWRPAPYNRAVGGAEGGDHPDADAFDLNYVSTDSRRLVERELRRLAAAEPWLELSMGFGSSEVHVGIQSREGGRRPWTYDDYVP